MKVRTLVLVVAWSLAASSACCLAQEPENFPDSTLTAEQWQQRVQNARRRSEEFVANARTRTADPPPSGNTGKEDAEATDQHAMNDPSLQPGDIIATSKGFLVFVGRDSDARQPSDFVPAPSPRYQANPFKAAR
jgi:hypothetical protein